MSTPQKQAQNTTTAQTAKTKSSAASKQSASSTSPSKVGAFVRYLEDSKKELGKVSWPTRKEIKVTGLAVLAMIVVMSIFLGLADLVLTKLVAFILS